MAATDYDIITVGGGLGSAALAKAMAQHGSRVLILEREEQFRDRVRGEYITPWGVAELRELGIYELIRESSGNDVPFVDLGFGPRNLPETTPQQLPSLGFRHPEMQEAVLAAAKAAGAEVRRGVTVTNVVPGSTPVVTFQDENGSHSLSARLVVAADGRTSAARKWGDFEVHEAPQPYYFAGLLLEGVMIPQTNAYLLFLPPLGGITAITPAGRGRFRAYVGYQDNSGYRLQGDENVARFLEVARQAEPVAASLDNVKPIGPLASFRGGDFWVDHPYKNGVVLLGDAACTSDPSFGQGLSITVRDARVLRDQLLATNDWGAAGNAYATDHDRYSKVIRDVEGWLRAIFLDQGTEADERRARAFPLISEDLSRVPDHLFAGPELPADDEVRKRFWAES